MQSITVQEIKKLIETNASLRSELKEYISSYVEWVKQSIPSGMEKYFGVGITSDNRWGTYWGFYNETKGQYTCTGKGYRPGGDFNLWVEGSSSKQMREFAKQIPTLIKEGLEKISEENKEIEVLIKEKITFS